MNVAETPMQSWLRCEPYLQDALDEGGNLFDLGDVLQLVVDGRARFWPGPACAMVTEIIDFPKARVLRAWLGGGDLEQLIEVLRPPAEAWGHAQGCTRFIICGRAGWVRALRDHGYLPKYTYVEKVIQ